MSRYMNKKLGN